MKKTIISLSLILTILLGLCGCDNNLNNTPTKQAEIFLGRYQTLDNDVLSDLDRVIAEEESFIATQRDSYKSIMKKHYQELEYEIKDERVDGNKATVIVEIEVDDYSKAINDAENKLITSPEIFNDENGKYDHSKYVDYELNLMKNSKDKVKYTLDLTFTKKDKKWVIDKLSDTDMEKINGTYKY